jgi:hypothetical protein
MTAPISEWSPRSPASTWSRQALDRVESALKATADVRKVDRTAVEIMAVAGGLFPGSFSATQDFQAAAASAPGGSRVTVDCYPKQRVLVDYGANNAAAERLAAHLGVAVS